MSELVNLITNCSAMKCFYSFTRASLMYFLRRSVEINPNDVYLYQWRYLRERESVHVMVYFMSNSLRVFSSNSGTIIGNLR